MTNPPYKVATSSVLNSPMIKRGTSILNDRTPQFDPGFPIIVTDQAESSKHILRYLQLAWARFNEFSLRQVRPIIFDQLPSLPGLEWYVPEL